MYSEYNNLNNPKTVKLVLVAIQWYLSTSYHDTLVKAAWPGTFARFFNFGEGNMSLIPIAILARIFLYPILTDFTAK